MPALFFCMLASLAAAERAKLAPFHGRPEDDTMRPGMKPIARYIEEGRTSIDQLVTASGLDAKLVKAIVSGNFTASPAQRQRLAAAAGLSVDEVSWGHAVPVEHLRGNGPQCGRPT